MAKKTYDMGAFLDEATTPEQPVAQRGAEKPESASQAVGQGPSKRLSLVLDSQTYAALRQKAFDEGTSHQALCEQAVRKFLGLKSK